MPYVGLASITVQFSYGPQPHTVRYRVLGSCYCGNHLKYEIDPDVPVQSFAQALGQLADHISGHIGKSE